MDQARVAFDCRQPATAHRIHTPLGTVLNTTRCHILPASLANCRSASPGPYQPRTESQRTTVVAEDLNRSAADLIYSDPAEAEKLLRDALTADIYHGPAHNNLGVLYLEQGKLYEAANEFEWARKLMPGAPDPRMNLALTLEVAGRVDDALREYETALEF